MKQWSKRKAQAKRVVSETLGAYGDMRGITGKSLQANEGLKLQTHLTDGNWTKALSST